jgi:hypothetical protein
MQLARLLIIFCDHHVLITGSALFVILNSRRGITVDVVFNEKRDLIFFVLTETEKRHCQQRHSFLFEVCSALPCPAAYFLL